MWNLFFGDDDDDEESSSGEEMLKKKERLAGSPPPIVADVSIRRGPEELMSTKITSNSSSNHAPSHQSTGLLLVPLEYV